MLHACNNVPLTDILLNLSKFSKSVLHHSLINIFQKGESLSQCLEMLTGAIGYLEGNVSEGSEWKKELGMIEIEHFLKSKNSEHQLFALNFVEKIAPRLFDSGNLQVLVEFCDIVADISEQSPSVSCRQKSFDILRWIFDATKSHSLGSGAGYHEEMHNKSRIALVKGSTIFKNPSAVDKE
jgi:hypothetical protein